LPSIVCFISHTLNGNSHLAKRPEGSRPSMMTSRPPGRSAFQARRNTARWCGMVL